MATGDGLLVRVKPRGGMLTAAAARLIAEQAAAHGNGVIELTNRGNLQVRGLSAASAGRFAGAMVDAGLAHPDPAAERRRNVIATPLAGLDPMVHPATASVTAALETALEETPALDALPAKFGFAVDGGGRFRLDPGDGDIRLVGDHAEVGGERVAIAQAVDAVIARALRQEGGERVSEPSPREAAGSGGMPAIGAVGGIAFGVGLPFGSAASSVWLALAEFGPLHLTPWRVVLIAGSVPPASPGLITDPADARLRVAACPGQPGCASASVVTRDVAARLQPPVGFTVHVSGCEKGCAHRGVAALTLVGREGRYDLVRDGRAGDVAFQRGLSAAEVLAL